MSDAVRGLLAVGTVQQAVPLLHTDRKRRAFRVACCAREHFAIVFRTVVIHNIPVGVTFIRYTYVITHNALFAIWQLEVLDLLQLSAALHTVYTFLCIFNVIRRRSPISRFLVSVYIHVLVQLA